MLLPPWQECLERWLFRKEIRSIRPHMTIHEKFNFRCPLVKNWADISQQAGPHIRVYPFLDNRMKTALWPTTNLCEVLFNGSHAPPQIPTCQSGDAVVPLRRELPEYRLGTLANLTSAEQVRTAGWGVFLPEDKVTVPMSWKSSIETELVIKHNLTDHIYCDVIHRFVLWSNYGWTLEENTFMLVQFWNFTWFFTCSSQRVMFPFFQGSGAGYFLKRKRRLVASVVSSVTFSAIKYNLS